MRAVLGRNFTLGLNALGAGFLYAEEFTLSPGTISTLTTSGLGGVSVISVSPSSPSPYLTVLSVGSIGGVSTITGAPFKPVPKVSTTTTSCIDNVDIIQMPLPMITGKIVTSSVATTQIDDSVTFPAVARPQVTTISTVSTAISSTTTIDEEEIGHISVRTMPAQVTVASINSPD